MPNCYRALPSTEGLGHRDAELDRRSRLYGEWHNVDFHFQIAQASRNGRLLDILYGDIWSLLRLYRFPGILSPGRVPNAPEDHDGILDALAQA
jgi:DNA-binding GntR family transcriptional regulator